MSKIESRDYQNDFGEIVQGFSKKEQVLVENIPRIESIAKAEEIRKALVDMDFVRCPGGQVLIGNPKGLKCSIEGHRKNETPLRKFNIPPFYIAKYTVTNAEYEKFDSRHSRTNTSLGDNNPVTCVTYGRALGYVFWLSQETGLTFSLPTEPQWVCAVAPYGWQYPHKKGGKPDRSAENVYKAFPESYPDGEIGSTLEVDSDQVLPNIYGIHHATGNVSVYTLGHYQTEGHWGALSDGSYSIVVGGNFRLCPFGSRVVTRGIIDVTAIVDTVGIRLVHFDPEHAYKAQIAFR